MPADSTIALFTQTNYFTTRLILKDTVSVCRKTQRMRQYVSLSSARLLQIKV